MKEKEEKEESYWFYSFEAEKKASKEIFFGNGLIKSSTNIFPFSEIMKSKKEKNGFSVFIIFNFQQINKEQFEECSSGY